MAYMFNGASSFNQTINFNTQNVTDMSEMFSNATIFNQPISFNTIKVTNMEYMFSSASSFANTLDLKPIPQLNNAQYMLTGTNLSTTNYSDLLVLWGSEPSVQTGVQFGPTTLQYYSYAETARANLTDAPNSWIITDGGLDPSCFNKGTKILTLNKEFQQEYVAIEDLKKGDLIKSYKHGFRKLEAISSNKMINNPANNVKCMYIMKKTDKNNSILTEDLIITGGHSILVDDLGDYKEENNKLFGGKIQMIDDKYLLLASISKDFIKIDNKEEYTYYQFILEPEKSDEERFGVWANGLLVETPSKKYFYELIQKKSI
jgi:hypothetical protein